MVHVDVVCQIWILTDFVQLLFEYFLYLLHKFTSVKEIEGLFESKALDEEENAAVLKLNEPVPRNEWNYVLNETTLKISETDSSDVPYRQVGGFIGVLKYEFKTKVKKENSLDHDLNEIEIVNLLKRKVALIDNFTSFFIFFFIFVVPGLDIKSESGAICVKER